MSGLLVIIVLGTLILILGLRLVLQSSNAGAQSPSVTIEEFANAREALDTVFVEAAAIERIFSTEDMEFVSHASAPKAQRRFIKERKTLPIHCLRKIQNPRAFGETPSLSTLEHYLDDPALALRLKTCFFPSIISCRCAAGRSISKCLYCPARLSAESTAQR